MSTLQEITTRVRDILDESTASQWTDKQLQQWINEGMRDIARETWMVKESFTIPTIAGTNDYTLNPRVLAVEFAYYLPGDGRQIPLLARAWENMDSIWGPFQNQQSGDPVVYTTWGYSPTIKLRVFPPPSQTAKNIAILCAAIPTELKTDGTENALAVPFPDAWIDAIEDYSEFKALRKDRDQRWQEAFGAYTSKRDALRVHALNTANVQMVVDPAAGYLPAWLAEFD